MLGVFIFQDIRPPEAYTRPGTGLFTDLIVYTLIIPVIPYRLETLGYTGIGAKVSWLLVAFVRSSVFLSCAFF